MASGFMLADALAEALRLPYRKGNVRVTTSYLMHGLKIGEHRILLKRNFDTACWIPPVGKRSSHSIYYGDLMLVRVIDFFCEQQGIRVPESTKKTKQAERFDEKVNWLKENLPTTQWEALLEVLCQAVAAYGRHEREHARNTSQDLKQTNRDLRLLGIPFMLFNLFEDARIEHISRQEQGIPFGWLEIEAMAPIDNPDPVTLFLRCIQQEGTPDVEALDSDKPFGVSGLRSVGNAAESVQGYYSRACECTKDEDLYPVMAEFLKEFKDDMPQPQSQSGGQGQKGASSGGHQNGAEIRSGDLSTAGQAAEEGEAFFESFEADAEVVGGSDKEGRKAEEHAKAKLKGHADENNKGKATSQGIPESITPQESGGVAQSSYFLSEQPAKLNDEAIKRVSFLTQRLLQMFKSHSLNQAIESPGRRMSSRHLAQGAVRFLHQKRFGGKGKRKYTILYDCSGSMQGEPNKEGKLFLLALNNLAKRGYLQGDLVLSGWVKDRPGWISYSFPVKEDIILSISPSCNAEGLQACLQGNLKKIKGVDDVFIYTDACICDAPLDRQYFASQGVWPVGLYVGSEDEARHMEKHFPQFIIRNTIEALVEKLVTRNRRTVG